MVKLMVRLMPYTPAALVALNLAIVAVNVQNFRADKELRASLDVTIARYRELAAALPPHACGTVIMPGERCEMTIELHTAREPSY